MGRDGGTHAPARDATVTWLDDGSPWATLHAEEVLFNADLTRYIGKQGP